MLFRSLPGTLLGFFLLARRSENWAAAWLAGASLFFYGWWDYHYVPLLLFSVALNYVAAVWIRRNSGLARQYLLTAAVIADLALLAYFKYADFFVSSIVRVTGVDWPALDIVLPAGISFFTFTQIAFLVDTYRGKVSEARPVHYLLFVTYFPHLIAGPVLHHKEMMPQFADRRNYRPRAMNFAVGLTLLSIGLA